MVVVISYQQTIKAYPKGGGSYIVTSDNLGVIPGLVAGSSIQVGYVLTVAVSVSAGVAALTSAFPALYENRVLIAVVAVAVMAWGNLRGLRESGTLFAAPAYIYLAGHAGAAGLRAASATSPGDAPVYVPPPDDAALDAAEGVQALGLLLVLRAFASGAVGLTGTEAIADGVAAFKAPESRNARIVLVVMATCFAVIFTGISFLSGWLHIVPDPHEVETVNSQLTRTLVGIGPFYYLVQFATAAAAGAGGEHRLRRLPPPGLLHGPGQVPPQPLRLPRRAPGLQQRDHHPGRRRRRADPPLPGQRHRPAPAVRDRRLHRLHPLPGGPRGPLVAPARARAGACAWRSTPSGPPPPPSWPWSSA